MRAGDSAPLVNRNLQLRASPSPPWSRAGLRFSVLRRPFANWWLNMAILWELVLLAAVIYVPFLQEPFGTFHFEWTDWALVGVLAFSVVPVLELVKCLERHGWIGELR